MKNYKEQVENIRTENDLKAAHIAICQAYSAYRLSHEEFMELRADMIAKRQEKGFAWGKGI